MCIRTRQCDCHLQLHNSMAPTRRSHMLVRSRSTSLDQSIMCSGESCASEYKGIVASVFTRRVHFAIHWTGPTLLSPPCSSTLPSKTRTSAPSKSLETHSPPTGMRLDVVCTVLHRIVNA